jgi:L-ascorbate metabolism protein UlaG (beta-lactamase superfamily)
MKLPSHFDGRHFYNLVPRRNGFSALLRWLLSRRQGQWRSVPELRPAPFPPRSSDTLRVTFVNHSTFLLQVNGINILTDPIWSDRASPVPWAGPRRYRAPGIPIEHLPPIDIVLLSHDHYDHMDLPTLRRLAREHRPTVFTGLRNARKLKQNGIRNAIELDWWQESGPLADLWITAVPAQHFSGRTPFDRDVTLWCGFVLQSRGTTIYFAGDTGRGPHIKQIAARFPAIDLAILPIGAYRPEWFMGEVHMSPQEALEAHFALETRVSVASHFGTFALADDGDDEAVEEMRNLLRHARMRGTEFWILGFGEGRQVPAACAAQPQSVAR